MHVMFLSRFHMRILLLFGSDVKSGLGSFLKWNRSVLSNDSTCPTLRTGDVPVSTQRLDKNASETLPEQAVNDEVDWTVDNHQYVADLGVIKMEFAAVSVCVVSYSPYDLVNESWGLADDKREDDDNDAERDMILRTAPSS